jgi:integrase
MRSGNHLRKDEFNRLKWTDIDWLAGKVRIPDTTTEESDAWLPVAPAVLRTLRELYESENRNPSSPYVFPGRSAQTRARRFTAADESLSGYNERQQSRSICGNTPRLRANKPLRPAEKKSLKAEFT